MPDCQKLRVAFAGTPEIAAITLRALLDSDHEVVGVLTQPDRPAGRGRRLTPSPVKLLAEQAGINVLQPGSLRDKVAVDDVASLQADVMVVIAYGLILPSDVLQLPALGCVNIHASLLPRWRGAAPIQRAILAGDDVTGICLMKMDEGLDTGPVWHTTKVPINARDNATTLHDKLAVVGSKALVAGLSGYCDGSLQPKPQSTEGVSYASKLDKQEATLDFSQPAQVLDCTIRAFNPWPVAETTLDGERLRIWQARAVSDDTENVTPGHVIDVGKDGVKVATGNGVLLLEILQRPGKKPLAAAVVAQGLALANARLGTE